jgi:hypothetical protein
MKTSKLIVPLLIVLVFSFSYSLLAYGKGEIQKTYDAKEKVKIELVLGSCEVKNSTDGKIYVHLVHSYDDDRFKPRFKEKMNTLYLEEKFYGNNPRGYSKWTLAIPEDTEIDFQSATGDLYIEATLNEIEGNSGTGDIEINNCRSKFDLNTGTGTIEVNNSQGDFDLNSGTGKVTIENSRGDFKANSGTGDDFDLSINSGTGDVLLDMQGSKIVGYFEFSAHHRKGRIVCPLDFDEEEEYWQGDSKYIRKSFNKEKETPRFFVSTGTGRAELKR